MRPYFLVGLFIFVFAGLFADYNDFEINPYITPEAREKIRPYLLPENHPARQKLDKIFLNSRATFNDRALENAGFEIKYKQPRSRIRVVSHPSLSGYLIKLVTDEDLREKKGQPYWYWLVNRCIGVAKIKEAMVRHQIKYFKAPNKWIYPLPIDPYPENSDNNARKTIVLLVDDMNLTSKHANLAAWKKEIGKKHLDELYLIIKEAGGRSYRAENIAKTKNGNFAFIDTEYPHLPPSFREPRMYLSPKNQVYWDKKVQNYE